MQEHPNLSDIEKATLNKTIVEISHLFIGDLLCNALEKDIEKAQNNRDRLWLQTTVDSGIFETRAYWIRKELKSAYPTTTAQHIAKTMFYHNNVGHTAEFLTYMTIAYAQRNNSTDYVKQATEILNLSGIEYGLIDKKLEFLTIYELVEAVLTAPVIWDDGEAEKK